MKGRYWKGNMLVCISFISGISYGGRDGTGSRGRSLSFIEEGWLGWFLFGVPMWWFLLLLTGTY
jgi:hypothetical protein